MNRSAKNVIDQLSRLLGERCTANRVVCEQHGRDESRHEVAPPDVVCFVHSPEEVAGVLKICNRASFPVVPFGAGTNVEGQVCAIRGGASIDMSEMTAITRFSHADMDCTVQAGVTREQLNDYLRDTGLFFPIDPGANATIGGMAATNASGTTTVAYGSMKENVLALRVALPSGELINTAGRARKSSAGYDLTRLFIGSEGTLGVITEVTLRLHGRTEAVSAARVCFGDIAEAIDTVTSAMQSGIRFARIELLDAAQIRAINRYSKTDYPEQATLFLEFHGSASGVAEQAGLFGVIAAEFGGSDWQWTANEKERRQMWSARHHAAFATRAARPGCVAVATDVCVPLSHLAECVARTREDIETHWRWPFMLTAHIGDGNFHYVFLIDPDSEAEWSTYNALYERLVDRALGMSGTCTGEHGIGLGKRKYLPREFGESGAALMRAIKSAIDPNNIMNPGKIFEN
jgi:D-lactate dehydrogenase (cytochrome)